MSVQNLSSNKSDSKIRTVCLNLYERVDKLATKYTKHKSIKAAVDRILKPHIHSLILTGIPEAELKQILNECYSEIQDIANEVKKGRDLVEARKLNEPGIQKFVENMPDNKEALELIPDGIV